MRGVFQSALPHSRVLGMWYENIFAKAVPRNKFDNMTYKYWYILFTAKYKINDKHQWWSVIWNELRLWLSIDGFTVHISTYNLWPEATRPYRTSYSCDLLFLSPINNCYLLEFPEKCFEYSNNLNVFASLHVVYIPFYFYFDTLISALSKLTRWHFS